MFLFPIHIQCAVATLALISAPLVAPPAPFSKRLHFLEEFIPFHVVVYARTLLPECQACLGFEDRTRCIRLITAFGNSHDPRCSLLIARSTAVGRRFIAPSGMIACVVRRVRRVVGRRFIAPNICRRVDGTMNPRPTRGSIHQSRITNHGF